MKYSKLLLTLILIGGTWQFGYSTCVLESDFGIVINCAFKKSGLFRVRNLGGVKAHVGWGLTIGDELGFKESLTNVDNDRRRSVQASRFQALAAKQAANNGKTGSLSNKLSINEGGVPPFKPIPPAVERPFVTQKGNGTKGANSVPMPAVVGVAIPAGYSKGAISGEPPQSQIMAVMIPKATDKISSSDLTVRTLPTQSALLPSMVVANSLQNVLPNKTDFANDDLQSFSSSTSYKANVFTKSSSGRNKVMNAPKEYYPVGYDKNFDDNFVSRVDLPETSFYCGDQKHFPGLYADEDLGCMVFHVCALTDDGLIMKSFLCPESTLFDQTILKCNWWFYVDCKNSKKLYDSNIPISKSYQLMKALTFFSSYKKDTQTQTTKD